MVVGMVVIDRTRESLLLSAGLAVVVAIGAVRQRRRHHTAAVVPSAEPAAALELVAS